MDLQSYSFNSVPVAPRRLPELVKHTIEHYPQMPLMLQENFTAKLLEMLRNGELDCAIMAEPFLIATPANHSFAARAQVSARS